MDPIRVLLISCVATVAVACASSNITPNQSVADGSIARPGIVLVYDFAVYPEDVVVDTLGSAFMGESKRESEGAKDAYATSSALARQLVAELRERGIKAQRADANSKPPLNAILLKGQFLTIDTGSAVKRMTVGFGAGSSELRARVQAYQATRRGLVRIAEAEAEAKGSKMPGMAVPLAGGAAIGTLATSAVISGGMNIARETRGAISPDAERMAEDIADRAEAFYKRQGWL